jgi:hypothetical protein
MAYRYSRSYPKPRLYDGLAHVVMVVGILAIAGYFLQSVGTSRETICTPNAAKVVTCQHRHREFLWLRSIEHPSFQLQSAEVTTYQASRSHCDSTEYYTAYQLDISGIQADGKTQFVTMKSYDESHDQAYVDLGKILDLRSGAMRQPLALGDINVSNLFAFLFLFGWMAHPLGWRIYLELPMRWTQTRMDRVIRSDEPIRCRPATTWTETPTEDRPNLSPEPVNRRINSLYSPSNSPSNKLN